MKLLLILVFSLLMFGHAEAQVTKYFTASGGGVAPCTNPLAPCALSQLATELAAGVTAIFKNGTYALGSPGNNISLDCNAGAPNGTAINRITFQAESERAVFTTGGTAPHFVISNCNYYSFIGFASTGGGATGTARATWEFNNSRNLILRRNLFRENNRNCGACSGLAALLVWLDGTSDTLIEENEFYNTSVAGLEIISFNYGSNHRNIFRRNFATDGTVAMQNFGSLLSIYGNGDDNIIENNIVWKQGATGSPYGITMGSFSGSKNNNKFIGNISIGTGFLIKKAPTDPARNVLVQDNVVIYGTGQVNAVQFFLRNQSQAIVRNNTGFGGDLTIYRHDFEGTITPTGDEGATYTNNIAINGTGAGAFVTDGPADTLTFNDLFNNTPNFRVISGSQNVSNTLSTDPSFGNCPLFLPSGSSLRTAGQGGGRVGAEILYATEGGVTQGNKALWNTTTKELNGNFVGAVVAGWNDTNGLSTLGSRLHPNCTSWPSGYGTTATIAITSPTTTATYITPSGTVTVQGTASCSTSISSVTWLNNRGGSGTATGTSTWSVPNISLTANRVNDLTFTVNCQ